MPRLLVQRKSWWKLRIPLLQPIQPTLLPPMLKRISLLSSLLAIVSRIQRRMQPMFVRSIRRLCHHWAMDTSHHLRMPRPMSQSWTPLQWKHCWPKQPTSIRCLFPRCHCWMYRLSKRITIQREMERLSLQRNLQDPTTTLNFLFLYKYFSFKFNNKLKPKQQKL